MSLALFFIFGFVLTACFSKAEELKQNMNTSYYVSDSYFKKNEGYDWVLVSLKQINDFEVKVSVRSPSKYELKKMLKSVEKEKKEFPNILKYFAMELIYSGNINSVFELYYQYDKLFPNEKNSDLLREIFINFKESRFFGEILNLNNLSILHFENLMKKNKIVLEEY